MLPGLERSNPKSIHQSQVTIIIAFLDVIMHDLVCKYTSMKFYIFLNILI